jgi:rubrerythrin
MIHARNASLITYDKDRQKSLPVKLLVQQGESKSEVYIRPKVYICKNCGYMSTKIDKKYLKLFK